jgi:membrane protein
VGNSAWREDAAIPKLKPRSKVKPVTVGRLEAALWFAAAVAILAWPRQAAPEGPATQPKPWWRRLLSGAWTRPNDEVSAAERDQPGRGRSARHPSEIPLKGLKDVLWRTWMEFNKDRAPAVAAGVAFYSLLAVFPAMAAFVSLYGLFADINTVRDQLIFLSGVLPADALTFVGEQMVRLALGERTGLGLAFAFGLLVSVWSANAAMKALFDGLNIAYEEREKRGIIKLNLVSLGFTLAALLFALVVVGAVVALPVALSFIGYGGPDPMLLLRWPLLLVTVIAALAVLYRFGPSRARPRWRWVSWGSVAAALLWLVASLAFSEYVGRFAHYDRTYGSLGAVIGFMTWTWLSVLVVLLGAELNAELEHQTAVDSTTGKPKPMGQRGAKMADTLGVVAFKTKPKGPDDPDMADPHALRAGAADR